MIANTTEAASGYVDFIGRKLSLVPPTGITGELCMPDSLFDHQKALVQWALRRGRAAIFADTGLGKSRMQLVWASEVLRHISMPILILAPLAVAAQTVGEGVEIGIEVRHVRDQSGVTGPAIYITNYDRMHLFDAAAFGGLVLDESSCIKHHNTRTFAHLCEAFRPTQFKLCATATPAPNDWTELGTHAEFLGICTRAEMLAEYFIHDGAETQVWRLKGHARAQFWRWVSTWGAMVRKPSDLGFDDSRYELPPLSVHQHTIVIPNAAERTGMLFAMEAQTLSERRDARRESIKERVESLVSVVTGEECQQSQITTANTTTADTTLTPSSEQKRSRQDQGLPKKTRHTCASTTSAQSTPEHQGHPSKEKGILPHGDSSTQATTPSGKQESTRHGSTESSIRTAHSLPISSSTDSPLSNTPPSTSSRAESAPFAGPVPGTESAGDSTSIIATQPESFADSCAQAATLGSESSRTMQPDFFGRLNTCNGSDDQWVIWCDLNAEQDLIAEMLGTECVSIYGSLTAEEKERRYAIWRDGKVRCLVTKMSIFGFGVNMQFCRKTAFVGVTDSWESYYQAVRRCWRFGQSRPVQVHIFASDLEGAVVANLRRKEADALAMAESLSAETREAVIREVVGLKRETNIYNAARRISVPSWLRSEAA